MHRADSVDYAMILSGEIYMLLDEDEEHLSAVDMVVQRGTNHACSKRDTKPCVIAFILIDGVTNRSANGDARKDIPAR